jgi:ribokinase
LPTDESLIFVSPSGENAIVSICDAAQSLSVEEALEVIGELRGGDLLLMQGNLSRSTTFSAFEAARAAKLRTLVNPAPIAFDYGGLWPMIDFALVNEVEAAVLGGSGEVERAELKLLSFGCRNVVVTLGAAGARLYNAGGVDHVRAPVVEAINTTGAGDVVCGVFSAGIEQGLSSYNALSWAVAAASLSVTRRGTGASFPTREELGKLRTEALGGIG